MAYTPATAIDMHRSLMERLAAMLSATLPVQTDAVDTDYNPYSTLSADATPATTEKVIVIRTRVQPNIELDIFGNAAQNFGPHFIDICVEANYASTSDNIADYLTTLEKATVFIEAAKMGCDINIYETANGTVPSLAALSSTNFKGTIRNNRPWGSLASQ